MEGIFVDVNIAQYNLKNQPFVNTFLTGENNMWELSGVSAIYELSNKGFKVYVRCNIGENNCTV